MCCCSSFFIGSVMNIFEDLIEENEQQRKWNAVVEKRYGDTTPSREAFRSRDPLQKPLVVLER